MSAHNIFHQENVKPDEKGTGLTPDFGGGSSTYKVAEAILGALEDAQAFFWVKHLQGMYQTFAVGHLALGYLLGRASSRLSAGDVNVSYLFLFSVLPDIDLVTQRFGLQHRGQTHSLVLFCAFFLPLFLLFRKKAFPYFVALAQHTLIGDLLTRHGVQLFWPLSSNWYEIRLIGRATGMTNIIVEWFAFLASMLFLFKFKDVWVFVRPHKSNLALLVPLLSVSFSLLPFIAPVIGFQRIAHYFLVPTALIIPYVAYFLLFTPAILADLSQGAKILVRRAMSHGSSA